MAAASGRAPGQIRSERAPKLPPHRLPVAGSACVKNAWPVAYAGEDQAADLGRAVYFDGAGSSDADGSIVSYSWQFGDGGTASGPDVTHVYDTAGVFTVVLTVADNCDAEAQDRVTVTITDPCEGNSAPTADAGADRAATAGEVLAFDGSGSFDGDAGGTIVSWEWDFGDGGTGAGVSVNHAFACEDDYVVSLTVADDCGATDSHQVLVSVSSSNPQELQADFKVYRLASVDPIGGTEEWTEIDLDNEEIELGLRIRLDASSSSGEIHFYSWHLGDGSYGSGDEVLHSYDEPGEYSVQLTIYDETWMQYDRVVRIVRVGEGMELLSEMPLPGDGFWPVAYAISGTEVWTVCLFGLIGVADISNPRELPALEIMPLEIAGVVSSMAASNGRLYIVESGEGVGIYRADRDNFALLADLSTTDLGVSGLLGVAAVEDYLYLATQLPDEILVLDVSDPARPVSLDDLTISVPGLMTMSQVGDDALVLHDGGFLLTVVDIRAPSAPSVALVGDLGTDLNGTIRVFEHQLAIEAGMATAIVDLAVTADLNMPIGIGVNRIVNIAGSNTALGRLRLYTRGYGRVSKYNIAHPGAPGYLMERMRPAMDGSSLMFVVDPDGPEGPEGLTLFTAIDVYGFASYVP